MAEFIHPDPWRTLGDHQEDRRHMKIGTMTSVASSVAAVISSVAALTAVVVTILR